MASVIFFKTKFSKDNEQLLFPGQHMRLIDLKHEIVKLKQLKGIGGSDLDLEIIDAESGKAYVGDDTYIPRNSHVTYRKIPAKFGQGLSSRDTGSLKSLVEKRMERTEEEKVIPVKAELSRSKTTEIETYHNEKKDPIVSVSASDVTINKPSSDSDQDLLEEEKKRIIAISNSISAATSKPRGSIASVDDTRNSDVQSHKLWGQRLGSDAVPPPNYVCKACSKKGHYFQNCPILQDGTKDISRMNVTDKISGVPTANFVNPRSLDYQGPSAKIQTGAPNIDPTTDSTPSFQTANPTASEYKRLRVATLSSHAVPNILLDPSKVPLHLKCPLSQGLLEDAVLLPCCDKSVCDSFIREKLLQSLKCPLCNKALSPDELRPQHNLRKAAEDYLSSLSGNEQIQKRLDNAIDDTVAPPHPRYGQVGHAAEQVINKNPQYSGNSSNSFNVSPPVPPPNPNILGAIIPNTAPVIQFPGPGPGLGPNMNMAMPTSLQNQNAFGNLGFQHTPAAFLFNGSDNLSVSEFSPKPLSLDAFLYVKRAQQLRNQELMHRVIGNEKRYPSGQRKRVDYDTERDEHDRDIANERKKVRDDRSIDEANYSSHEHRNNERYKETERHYDKGDHRDRTKAKDKDRDRDRDRDRSRERGRESERKSEKEKNRKEKERKSKRKNDRDSDRDKDRGNHSSKRDISESRSRSRSRSRPKAAPGLTPTPTPASLDPDNINLEEKPGVESSFTSESKEDDNRNSSRSGRSKREDSDRRIDERKSSGDHERSSKSYGTSDKDRGRDRRFDREKEKKREKHRDGDYESEKYRRKR